MANEIPGNAPQCVADMIPALGKRAQKAVFAWLEVHAQYRAPVTAGSALAVAQALEQQKNGLHVAAVFRAFAALLVARGDTVTFIKD